MHVLEMHTKSSIRCPHAHLYAYDVLLRKFSSVNGLTMFHTDYQLSNEKFIKYFQAIRINLQNLENWLKNRNLVEIGLQ